MFKRIYLGLLLSLVTTLLACASIENVSLNSTVENASIALTPTGLQNLGYVSVGIQERSGEPFWRTYAVADGESFRGYFVLSNQTSATDYVITCLLDYIQIPCNQNGEARLLNSIHLDSHTEESLPFATPPLPAGFHDFIILALKNIRSSELDTAYRINTDFNFLYASRAVLLAWGKPWAVPSTAKIDYGSDPISNIPYEGIIINREQASANLEAWTTYYAQPEEVINYYIHVGNSVNQSEPVQFALLAFLDYKQVPIDSEQFTVIASMPPNSELTLPSQVIAPREPGVYELMILYAYNPYTLPEAPELGKQRELTSTIQDVFTSIRVAIVVK